MRKSSHLVPAIIRSKERGGDETRPEYAIEFRRTGSKGERYSTVVIGELTMEDLKALQRALGQFAPPAPEDE